jgi:ATP-dependent DNA ligase
MNLPVPPPVAPMLAKLEPDIPRGPGWRYEPKWDGFRAIVFRDGDEIRLESRDNRPLARYFPELLVVLAEALPPRCVVDGEIVLARDGRLEFDLLQLRLHPAQSRVDKLAGEIPTSYVAFDLLAEGSESLLDRPLAERRAALELALRGKGRRRKDAGVESLVSDRSQVLLTPQTGDADEAARWFVALEPVGLDGIIAKRDDSRYSPGKRTMVKVKHRRTADCVVGGYRLHKSGDGIGSLLLGVYDDEGTLHYLGHTSSFSAQARRDLLKQLRPLEGGESYADGRSPGGGSRWTGGKEAAWVALRPVLVCEVSYDYLQGDRFRHAATFVRWRDDKPPTECRFDQLERPGGPSSGHSTPSHGS